MSNDTVKTITTLLLKLDEQKKQIEVLNSDNEATRECVKKLINRLEDSEKQALQIQADYESVLSRSVDEINQRLEKIEAYIEKQKDISNII